MKKILSSLCILSACAFGSNDAFESGTESANSLLNHFKGNMNATITNPITNNSALTSIDGTVSGSASITCNDKSIEFIDITYSGNDSVNISVSMDNNGDGSKESHYSFSGINNICTNGFAKCSSNVTSKNDSCKFYTWVNTNNQLSTKEIDAHEAVNCSCVSSYCGGLANTSKENLLQTIGSGLISAFSMNSNNLIIGGSDYKNDHLIYYASKPCDNTGAMPNVTRDSNLSAEATNLINQQKLDENSVYSIFEKSTKNTTTLDANLEQSLQKTTSEIGSSLQFNQGKTNNSFSYSTASGAQNASLQSGEVEQLLYCEVQFSEVTPTLFSDNTVRGKTTNSNSVIKTEIKECKDNVCPLEAGQSIKHACGKIDNFIEAIGILSGVEEATKDFQCSK